MHAGIELTSDTPEDVGTAAVGTATDASRADHVHGGGGGGGSPADPSQLGTAVTISTTPAEYPLGEDLDSANDYEFVFLSANGNAPARISGYALLNNIDAVATTPATVAESFGIRVPRQNTTSITNTAGSAVRVWRKDAATLWVAAGRNDAGVTVVVNKVPR